MKEWSVHANPALKLRLENFSQSLLRRQGDAPTVSSVQLSDVAKQFTSTTLFWEEYLSAVDEHFVKGLLRSVESCQEFQRNKAKVRHIQSSIADEEGKKASLAQSVTKAEGKGEDVTAGADSLFTQRLFARLKVTALCYLRGIHDTCFIRSAIGGERPITLET